MPRPPRPRVVDDALVLPDAGGAAGPIALGSAAWYAWLAAPQHTSFTVVTATGAVTVRQERQGQHGYWYAYRKHAGQVRKVYLGTAGDVTAQRLQAAALRLHEHAAPTAPPLRLRLLGPPQLDGPAPVPPLPAKALALLGYLAVLNTPVPRERLLGLLWPDSGRTAAHKNLRNTLWTIRRGLGTHVVDVGDVRLALNAGVRTDVRTFLQGTDRFGRAQPVAPTPPPAARDEGALAESLDLYRGPLLDELVLHDAPEFELWLTTEREHFHQRYLQATLALVAVYHAAGNWTAMVDLARQALRAEPLHEPLQRALMEAHARLGDRATALRCYDTFRATLAQELHVTPSSTTEALRTAIQRGRLLPAAGHPPAPAIRLPLPAVQRQPTPFIGRHGERRALDAELTVAAGGQARIVLLQGELGIGKTRLWQEWAAGLGPNHSLLATTCLAATQTLPLTPVLRLVSSVLEHDHLAGDPADGPAWLGEVARLLPGAAGARPAPPAVAPLSPAEERRRIFEALVQFLQAYAATPLILVLDDLHWADQATLDWLAYLVSRLHAAPLLLIATYRPQEAPAGLRHLLVTWTRMEVVRRLALAPLTPDEARTLATAVAGAPAVPEALLAHGGGNPYFVIELARAGPGALPVSLVELVRLRLAQLPDSARRVLQAAVVLQPEGDLPSLRAVSGGDEEALLDALDALLDADVLVEQDGRYGFTHPLVAAVITAGLSAARRRMLHGRAAAAREAIHTGHLEQIAGQLLIHHREAGNAAQAAHYAELAGAHALTLAAPVEALYFYQTALELAPTPRRQVGLGQALAWQGKLAEARAALEAAATRADGEGDRPTAAQARLQLAQALLAVGQAAEATALAETSLAQADDPAVQAVAHFLLGTGWFAQDRALTEVEAQLTMAAGLAEHQQVRSLASAIHFGLGNVRAQRGDLVGAIAAFQEVIAQARASGDAAYEIMGQNNLAYHAVLRGDLETARAQVEPLLTLVETHDLDVSRQWLYGTRGELALAEGQWAAAADWFTRGLAAAERYGNREQAARYQAQLGRVALSRGAGAEAVGWLERAREQAGRGLPRYLRIQIDLWLADAYGACGAARDAAAALGRAEASLAGREYGGLQRAADERRRQVHARGRVADARTEG